MAGIELIFSIVPCMVIGFWIYDQNNIDCTPMFQLLISSHLHSSASVKTFSSSHPVPAACRLRMHNRFGGITAGISDSNWPEGYSILYVIMLSDKSWGGGKKEEEGTFIVTTFVFPSNHDTRWSPTFPETAERLPANEKRMNSFFWFAWTCRFCFPHLTVFISNYKFLHFYSSPSLPHPTGRHEWVAVWAVSVGQGYTTTPV